MIADPNEVTEELLEAWVKDFDYWEICDQCVLNLFEKSQFAYLKSFEWVKRKEEYVKRAGFVLMARLAFGDRKATDDSILEFLPAIKENINDDRNTVKKAISWALREMGKRSIHMNKRISELATELKTNENKTIRWIASDVIRDISRESVKERLQKRASKSN